MQAFSQIVWNVHFLRRFGSFDGKRNESYAFYISWVWENGWLFRSNFFTIILIGLYYVLTIKIINIHALQIPILWQNMRQYSARVLHTASIRHCAVLTKFHEKYDTIS